MAANRFDFQGYIDQRMNPHSGRDERTGFGEYAFSGDLAVLKRLERLKPVNVVVETTVRLWKSMQRNELLGTSVKVTRRQFPRLHAMIQECAETLHIPAPTVYVTSDIAHLNAATYGTEDEAFIVLYAALVDALDDQQLKFVIGHECGHIQNNHVVYATALNFLRTGIGTYVRWAVVPAQLALNGWSRRGEITCDRAGLLCCGDLDAASRAIMRLAVGSKKLMENMDTDEYMRQLDELREGLGRLNEYWKAHPYLPKRLQALQLFGESDYYKAILGERAGRPLDDIDREVEKLIQVY